MRKSTCQKEPVDVLEKLTEDVRNRLMQRKTRCSTWPDIEEVKPETESSISDEDSEEKSDEELSESKGTRNWMEKKRSLGRRTDEADCSNAPLHYRPSSVDYLPEEKPISEHLKKYRDRVLQINESHPEANEPICPGFLSCILSALYNCLNQKDRNAEKLE